MVQSNISLQNYWCALEKTHDCDIYADYTLNQNVWERESRNNYCSRNWMVIFTYYTSNIIKHG